MKFIYDHPENLYHLNVASRSFALAEFFFHHRGSAIDRSLKGLLRALLLQILGGFSTTISNYRLIPKKEPV